MASEFLNLRQGVALPEGSPVVVECREALERKRTDPEAASVSDDAKAED